MAKQRPLFSFKQAAIALLDRYPIALVSRQSCVFRASRYKLSKR